MIKNTEQQQQQREKKTHRAKMFRMRKWARVWANNVEITTERVKVNKKNEKHWNNSISRKNHGVIFICPNFRDKFHGRPKWKVRCDISFDILRHHISPSTLGMVFLGCWFRSNLLLTFTLIIVPYWMKCTRYFFFRCVLWLWICFFLSFWHNFYQFCFEVNLWMSKMTKC